LINKIKKIILDHLLSQNDWMQSKLIEHKSKILAIEISGYKVIFIVEENGQLRTINESEKIDCTIKLTINDFINQIVNNQNGKITIEGDMELANQISQVLKNIKWDIEDDLSMFIGDIPAVHTTNFLKKVLSDSKKNVSNLKGSLIEYWQEENPILAKKRDVEFFNSQVDIIVEDTERIEVRLISIIKKIRS
jgi:ubiquinone biosynthesis protein UbiJ|tara:strand:+ start:4658 stop:5233 length:576 start_codon:yes stop_codon:yes gene_type:complete